MIKLWEKESSKLILIQRKTIKLHNNTAQIAQVDQRVLKLRDKLHKDIIPFNNSILHNKRV